jgi:adsorption protein B
LVEPVTAGAIALMQAAGHELLLAAAVGIFLLGAEDILFDLLWFGNRPQSPLASSEPVSGTIAIFVPAWREEAVLPDTLRSMLAQWRGEDIRIFVGCYPNDHATLLAVSALAARHPALRLVVARRDGPTSKADNLNQMWQALGEDERAEGMRFAAIVLHDAEDIVHRAEITLFRSHLRGAAMVQIPVEPLIAGQGPIAAHYADEFAEAHGKEMPLRAAYGAALPAAGVGVAFSRSALVLLALERPDGPFSADSLTEDYEAGLMLGASGAVCRFVALTDRQGDRIAVRSAFPASLEAAVRQKGRWIAGIALGSWDRLDWRGASKGAVQMASDRSAWRSFITGWMLWRDRRAPLAALIILCAYAALLLAGLDRAGQAMGWWSAAPLDAAMVALLTVNGALLLWRLTMRAMFTGLTYGWRQGLFAVPRAFVSNIIHILSARRAMLVYLRQLLRRELVWDKTEHRPHSHPAAPRPSPIAVSQP